MSKRLKRWSLWTIAAALTFVASVLVSTLIEFDEPPAPAMIAATAEPAAVPASVRGTYVAADKHGFVPVGTGLVRYAVWNARAARPRGSVLVLQGRGEFIEKYATEIVPELLARGFSVYALDWHGQGLSERLLPDRQKGHVDGYDTYQADLRAVLASVVAPEAPRPLIALTHSMGGHNLLRHFAEAGADSPVSAALMVAPMTALRKQAIASVMISLFPDTESINGRYFYGSRPFRLIGREFVGNKVTHDERRFRFSEAWYGADSRLALGGPTIGWMRATLRSLRALHQPGYLERIVQPVRILSAGQDLLIGSSSHREVCARLARCTVVDYPDARHEIMMETDPVRARFLADFDRFAEIHAPAPK